MISYILAEDDKNNEQAEFIRNQYYGLEWYREAEDEAEPEPAPLGTGLLLTDTDFYCQLRLARAGSFHYYFVYDNA